MKQHVEIKSVGEIYDQMKNNRERIKNAGLRIGGERPAEIGERIPKRNRAVVQRIGGKFPHRVIIIHDVPADERQILKNNVPKKTHKEQKIKGENEKDC